MEGSIASAMTSVVDNPLLAVAQLAPPSVVLRIPEPVVPANAVDGSTGSVTSATTLAPSGPIAVQRLTPVAAGKADRAATRTQRLAAQTRGLSEKPLGVFIRFPLSKQTE